MFEMIQKDPSSLLSSWKFHSVWVEKKTLRIDSGVKKLWLTLTNSLKYAISRNLKSEKLGKDLEANIGECIL